MMRYVLRQMFPSLCLTFGMLEARARSIFFARQTNETKRTNSGKQNGRGGQSRSLSPPTPEAVVR